MTSFSSYIALTCLLLSIVPQNNLIASQQIQLTSNSYRNILIAISDTVTYNKDIIPGIKELFNDASARLFKATGFRAYFKDVTILIPSKWNVTADAATTETFDKANIRVDNPSSRYGDNPWVQQTAGCGVPGDFMHITPNFVVDRTNSEKKWGPLDKVIVHEWGHLRWGLFDEYPVGDDVTEHFYQSSSTGTLEASRCNINVKGRLRHRKTGQDCKIDAATSLPEPDCRYYPNKAQSSAISSLMYYHFLPTVDKFCDDDDLGDTAVHNYEAPSQHNRLCAGKSAWEIMRMSDDFKNNQNTAVDDDTLNTNVTFRLVQRKESKVVVVMDVSGSMKTNDYYKKLNAAVRRYILYTAPTGSSVALVKYSTSATELIGLTEIKSDADRQLLANRVPLEMSGGTAIGKGLKVARGILKAGGADPAGSRIILLTDGEENVEPFVNSVKPDILTDGIIVDTILMTPTASNVLISLAASTGGLSFYSSGDSKSTSLNDAFTTSERSRISNPRDAPVTVESRVFTAESNNISCFSVMIDKSLGTDTTLTFSWDHAIALDIEVANSGGSQTIPRESTNQAAGWRCMGQCPTGTWRICITNNANTEESVVSQIESSARPMNGATEEEADKMMPITVRTSIPNRDADFNNANAAPVKLFASVTRGYAPVIGAKVVALIEYPDGNRPRLELSMRDDGAGADINKDDGTYSAMILNSDSVGKHSISVQVVGESNTKVKTVTVYSAAGAISEPGEGISKQEVTLTPTDEFQRFSLAGYIAVESIAPPGTDKYPPSRIIDLQVTSASYDSSTITLEWTAVGDDFDEGSASKYELYRADSHRTLYKAIQNASLVNQNEVTNGNLSSPRPAYSRERLELSVPDRDAMAVYAIIVKDAAGNPSELSNVVSSKLVYVAPEEPEKSSNVGLIVGVSIGSIAIVCITIVIVLLVCKGKKCGGSATKTKGNTSTHTNKGYLA